MTLRSLDGGGCSVVSLGGAAGDGSASSGERITRIARIRRIRADGRDEIPGLSSLIRPDPSDPSNPFSRIHGAAFPRQESSSRGAPRLAEEPEPVPAEDPLDPRR